MRHLRRSALKPPRNAAFAALWFSFSNFGRLLAAPSAVSLCETISLARVPGFWHFGGVRARNLSRKFDRHHHRHQNRHPSQNHPRRGAPSFVGARAPAAFSGGGGSAGGGSAGRAPPFVGGCAERARRKRAGGWYAAKRAARSPRARSVRGGRVARREASGERVAREKKPPRAKRAAAKFLRASRGVEFTRPCDGGGHEQRGSAAEP